MESQEPQNDDIKNLKETDESPQADEAVQPPIEDQFKPQDTPPKPKKSKKKLLIILLVLLLLAAAGGAYYWFFMKKSAETQKAPQTAEKKEEEKQLYFYIAKSNQPTEYTLYNVKTKAKSTEKLTLDKPLLTNSIDSNQPLQILEDNSLMGYSSGAPEDLLGEGSGTKDTNITIVKDGTATKVVTYESPQKIEDWVFSNDGSTIYFLLISPKGGGSTSDVRALYKYDLSTKKTDLIKGDVVSSESSRTRLYAVGDKDVRFYSSLRYNIKEHAYTSGAYAEKAVPSTQCNKTQCSLAFPQALSPDGKSLLTQGSASNSFVIEQLTISDGTFKQLIKASKSSEQMRAVIWSSDSKQVAVDNATYSSAGQNEVGFEYRVNIIELASGTVTKTATDTSPGIADGDKYNDHFIELLKWSPDNMYVAFVNQNKVKLYNTADKSTIDTEIAENNPVNSGTSYGWIYK